MGEKELVLEERETSRPGTGKEIILWKDGLSISGCEKHDVVNKVSDISTFFELHIKDNDIRELTLFEMGSGGLWGTMRVCRHILDNCNLNRMDIILSDAGYSDHLHGLYDITSREFSIDHRSSTVAVLSGNDIISGSYQEITKDHKVKVNIHGADQDFFFREVCAMKKKNFHGFYDERLMWPEHRINVTTFMRQMLQYRNYPTKVTVNVCGRLTDDELFDWDGLPEVFTNTTQPLFYYDIHMHYRISILMSNYLRERFQGNVIVANAFDSKSKLLYKFTKRFFKYTTPWKLGR